MFHLIFNPVSGMKKAIKKLRIVERIFKERNIAYETHESKKAGGAGEIARELTEKGENDIIVLGGDGTLNEVLNGISDPSVCRLGLIPSGTGNDFAACMGIPNDAEKATLKILNGEAKPIDYIDVSGMRSINVTGVGIDVEVLLRGQKGKLKGKLKYLKNLLACVFKYKGISVEVESDGVKETHSALLAAACNGKMFGGGIRICPEADPMDGKIDVVVVDCIGSAWKILHAFVVLMSGKILKYSKTTHFRCESVRFRTPTPCACQLDGEVRENVVYEATIKKGLRFYL